MITLIQLVFSHDGGAALVSPKDAFIKRITVTRDSFKMQNHTTWNGQPIEHIFSTRNVVIGVVYTWLYISAETVNIVAELFFVGVYPTILWVAAKNFQTHFENITKKDLIGNQNAIEEIIDRYEDLKAFSNALNQIFGMISLWWIIEMSMRSIFYFSETENTNTWKGANIAQVVFLCVSLLFGCVAVVLAATVFSKVHLHFTLLCIL